MHADTIQNFLNYPSLKDRLRSGSAPFVPPLDRTKGSFGVEAARATGGTVAPSLDGATPMVDVGCFGGPGRTAWDVMPRRPADIRALFSTNPAAPFILLRHLDGTGLEWRHVVDTRTGRVGQVPRVTRVGVSG